MSVTAWGQLWLKESHFLTRVFRDVGAYLGAPLRSGHVARRERCSRKRGERRACAAYDLLIEKCANGDYDADTDAGHALHFVLHGAWEASRDYAALAALVNLSIGALTGVFPLSRQLDVHARRVRESSEDVGALFRVVQDLVNHAHGALSVVGAEGELIERVVPHLDCGIFGFCCLVKSNVNLEGESLFGTRALDAALLDIAASEPFSPREVLRCRAIVEALTGGKYSPEDLLWFNLLLTQWPKERIRLRSLHLDGIVVYLQRALRKHALARDARVL